MYSNSDIVSKRIGNIIDPSIKAMLYALLDGRDRVSTRFAIELELKAGTSFTSILKRIDPLVEQGLIQFKQVGASRLISITEKGRKVAEKLREIDKIMEE